MQIKCRKKSLVEPDFGDSVWNEMTKSLKCAVKQIKVISVAVGRERN